MLLIIFHENYHENYPDHEQYRKLIILGKVKKHAHSHDHDCQERICGCTAWCLVWLLVSQCSFSGASKLFWNLKFSFHQGQSKGEVQHWGEDFLQPPIWKHQYLLPFIIRPLEWETCSMISWPWISCSHSTSMIIIFKAAYDDNDYDNNINYKW